MPKPIHILILEDSPADAELLVRELRRTGFQPDWRRVETREDFLAHLHPDLDLILADTSLPQFDGLSALRLLQTSGLDVPFMLISGSIGEELPVTAMQHGAADYLMKDRLTRLGLAVTRALEEKRLREEKRGADKALQSNQALLANILTTASEAIITVDEDNRIVFFNRAAEEIFGYTDAQVVGQSLDLLIPSQFAQRHHELIESFVTSSESTRRISHRYTIRGRRKDGTEFPANVGISKSIQDGRLILTAILEDVTERDRAERELERRALQFSALHETSRDLMLNQDLPELLQMIAERAAAILKAAGGGIYLYDEEKGDLQVQTVGGVRNPPLGARVPLGEGLAGRVAETRRSMIVDDYRAWDHRFPQYGRLPFTAVAEVPMLYGSELVGVLVVNEFEPTIRKFTGADVQLLQLFADQAASVVHDARMFQQVRSGRERLQSLSRQLIQAQEVERRHIARELHDEIGQVLTTVKTNLQALQLSSDALASSDEIAESMLTIDRALLQVRNLSLDLRPSILDDFGLVTALQWYLGRQGRQAGFIGELIVDPSAPRLPSDLETVCFRVAQEALTNIIRYARAKRVIVKLELRDQDLRLEISDDGVGFDVEAARKRALEGNNIGLLGMQERVLLVGGQFRIESSPSNGTRIIARFPRSSQGLLERRQIRRGAS